jgi:hypothetical protein
VLRDTDSDTRCTGSSYILYWSNDNYNYTQIQNVTFNSSIEWGVNVHSFEFNQITAKYIKIHTVYSDNNYTFVLNPLQSSIGTYTQEHPVGYLDHDTNPSSGAIGNWGVNSSGIALDAIERSIGLDLLSPTSINRIEIRDTDISTRCTSSSYDLYWSNDNSSYTQIPNVIFSSKIEDGVNVHLFDFNQITARYIKIHTLYGDINYTFVLNPPQYSIKAFAPEYTAGYADQDTSPTTGVIGNWGMSSSGLALDAINRSVGLDLLRPKNVSKIELRDTDSNTRCDGSSYVLYWSNDNSNYTQITNVVFTSRIEDGVNIQSFHFNPINARYFKIHTVYSDDNYTFVLNPFQSSIKAFGPEYMAGYLDYDTNPASGAMSNWGMSSSGVSVDAIDRSVGLDMLGVKNISRLELFDTDSSTRCTSSSYTLFWSIDNTSYTQIADVMFSSRIENGVIVHTFEFSSINARYIKIHTVYSDNDYTFILNPFQDSIKAFTPEFAAGYLDYDTNPANGAIGDWGMNSSGVAVDAISRSVGLDLSSLKNVNGIELRDTDSNTRCISTSYVLYWSNDNSSYTQITNVEFSSRIENGIIIHSFEFTPISARYIKIHTVYSDNNFTFVLNPFQSGIKIFY